MQISINLSFSQKAFKVRRDGQEGLAISNERQLTVFDRMTREGSKGFAGGMRAGKYQKIAHTSKATATRDLSEMVGLGVLVRLGEGAGVRYEIA
jgi:Fic family protein